MVIRFFLLSAFMWLHAVSYAQSWFPMDATWYYNQVEFWPEGNYYNFFEVAGEAVIKGKSCRLVLGSCTCSAYEGSNYLYEEGDRVYRYDPDLDSFTILYDFNLNIGDTIYFEFSESTIGSHELVDISTAFINGKPVRVQHFEPVEWYVSIGSKTYEYIGKNECLYPQYGFCDPLTSGLRCYEDSYFGLEKFNGWSYPCDTTITSTESLHEPIASVFPIPADDFLHLDLNPGTSSVELIDMLSAKSLIRLKGQSETLVPVSHLPSGPYLLKIRSQDRWYFRKIIIAH